MVTTKKPQLANFYSNVRKSFQIFVKDNKPIGDKWSFDEDNRKRVPKGYQSPKSYTFESKYFEEIKKLIVEAMPDATVEIKDLMGDNNHYSATTKSKSFNGLNKIEQHKLVYKSLKGKMGNELHALSITTEGK